MLKWADNVVETSTTTTTGTYQLGGVPASGERPGTQTFVAGIGDTHTCYYYAYEVSGTAYEFGIGTVTDAATDTLTRTTIHRSSNGGSAVDWTGKTLRVAVVNPAYALQRMTRDHAHLAENLSIVTSRTGNAETIALKTAAGSDPSSSDPIRIAFRNATAGTGDFTVLEVTAATSSVISSGSTLGATSATAFRLWLVGFNDAGTFRLGVIKCALTDGVYGLQDNVLESSTAEGGAGAADSSGVIYTGTAVTSKAMRVLGYLEYTLTTAGTWDAAPSVIQLYSHGDRLPGETVQTRRAPLSATSNPTTVMPGDDSIPQNNEGDEILTVSLTPKSAVNLLQIEGHVFASIVSQTGTIVAALFRDSMANALAATGVTALAADYVSNLFLSCSAIAGAASSTTFTLRCGPNASDRSVRINGSGGRWFGGVASTSMTVREIMV